MKYRRIIDTRGLDEADAYARRTAENAVRFVTDNPMVTDKGSALLKVSTIQHAASRLPWAVYGGPGARRALEAVFLVAHRTGRVNFGLALREFAELSGQPFSAVRKHRATLENLGWIVRNPDDRLGRTARFVLRVPSHIHSHGEMGMCGMWEPNALAHDAFRQGALGDVGWYVVHEIGVHVSRRDLRSRTGLDGDDLDGLLGAHTHLGVVQRDELHLRLTDPVLPVLDAAARTFGTAGALAADRVLHTAQRTAFRDRGDVNVRGTR